MRVNVTIYEKVTYTLYTFSQEEKRQLKQLGLWDFLLGRLKENERIVVDE